MCAERKQAKKEQTIYGNGGLLLSRAQDPDVRIEQGLDKHSLCINKICGEARDILRDGSGDLLKNRFGLMMKNDEFHC